MCTIEEVILDNARRNPDKVAVKSGKDIATYSRLRTMIMAAAEYYKRLPGYARGESIILSAGKQIEFVSAYFGAHMAGLVVAPVAEDINPTRFDYICKVLKPFVAVGVDSMETSVPRITLAAFKDLNTHSGSGLIFPNSSDVADVLFTTGTTGAPKGVPLTYANELAAANQINAFIRNQTDDIELLALPVSHSFGLGRLRCCLVNAQTIVLLGSFANVKRIFRTIEEERVTGFTMVPASWKFLQKMVGDRLADYADQIRYMELGSSFFSEDDKRHLASLFPKTRVTMHYGLTEASRSTFMEFHDDDAHLSSVGKASPGVEIAIFDERGFRLPAGREGEICVKGAHVMPGYLMVERAGGENRWTKDSSSFHGEFLRTGDCGVMTSEGYVYLKSRIKELINVGGKKVAPTEVDEQILKIPGVTDCACVGVPDPGGVLGEVVKGCVVKAPGMSLTFEQIAAALVGKLESYKIPVVWQWIDTVPKTQNGKIQRMLLK